MWAFGPFQLDPAARVLYRDDRPVALTPKQVDTLLVLVREQGQVVERERLLAEVWPGVFVEDGGLTRNVSAIRRALGSTGDEFIETVPKRGYRFVAQVSKQSRAVGPPAAPVLPEPPVSHGAAPPAVPQRFTAARLGAALLVLLFVLAGAIGLWRWQAAGRAPAPTSFAVLPFHLLSAAESDRYLAIGLADLVTTRLSSFTTISVRPSSSTLAYAGADPIVAGRDLNVEAVIDGSLRREGDRLRLTVQVIGVASGTPLYAGSFDERGGDLLALESALSDQVLGLVVPRVLPGERQAQARRGTSNAAALDEYLRGRFAMLARRPDRLDEAIAAFTRATSLDPDFALAHANLASAWALLGGYQFRAPSEVYPQARTAALRALALDENLAEAHAALSEVAWSFDYDWAAADRAQRRALELAPLEPQYHQWRAYYLAALGRGDEAMTAAEHAVRLAPNDLPAALTRAGVAYWSGRYDEAIVFCQRAATMAPGDPTPLLFQHFSLYVLGRLDEARALFTRIHAVIPEETLVVAMSAIYASRDGRLAEARRLLDGLVARHRSRYVEAVYIAGVYAALGEMDTAVEWLEQARRDHSAVLPMLAVDPMFRAYHGDPRFKKVLAGLQRPAVTE
jgi:DNA-binding winged helix-turn-helix (wHTH) protein/TolB-like protein/Flp pilus assembly protein TadD